MAIYHSHKERQQRNNQPNRPQMDVPSTYSHESEDAGDDSTRTESCVDGSSVITVASSGTVPLSSDAASPFICLQGLPRSYGLGHSFVVNERICWTDKRNKAKLESQAASTLFGYFVGVIKKTEHARRLQCKEPSGSKEDVGQTGPPQMIRNRASLSTTATTTMTHCCTRETPITRVTATRSCDRQPSSTICGKYSEHAHCGHVVLTTTESPPGRSHLAGVLGASPRREPPLWDFLATATTCAS